MPGDARQQSDTDQNKSCSRIKQKLSLMPIDKDFCNLCALMGSGGYKKAAVLLLYNKGTELLPEIS